MQTALTMSEGEDTMSARQPRPSAALRTVDRPAVKTPFRTSLRSKRLDLGAWNGRSSWCSVGKCALLYPRVGMQSTRVGERSLDGQACQAEKGFTAAENDDGAATKQMCRGCW